jgi:hypothetical protein
MGRSNRACAIRVFNQARLEYNPKLSTARGWERQMEQREPGPQEKPEDGKDGIDRTSLCYH